MSNRTPIKNTLPIQLPQLRWLLVPVVWLLVAILAPQIAFQDPVAIMFIGLVAVLASMVILLRWPGLGFPLLVVVNLLVPLSIRTGTLTTINISLLLVSGMIFLWVFEMIARDRQVRLIRTGVMLPSLLFILVSSLAFFFGQLNWYPTRPASTFAQIGGLIIMVLSIATLVVTVHRLQDVKWLKWAVWSLIILGGIYATGFLFPSMRFSLFRIFQRAVSDSLFWTWLVVMAFSQAYLNRSLHLRWRIAAGFVVLVGLYNLLIFRQAWASGWLPTVIAMFVVLLLTRPRWAIGLAAMTGLFVIVRSGVVSDFLIAGDNEYSLVTRLEAWRILLEIIKMNPLFGLGPANYYFYTPFYDILGYSVSFNSHNQYIDIVAQIGLLGLFSFLWIFWEVLRAGWGIHKIVQEGFDQAFLFGALGGTVGTLAAGIIGDWILPFVYNVGMDGFRAASLGWFFMGAMVFMAYRYRVNSGQEVSNA